MPWTSRSGRGCSRSLPAQGGAGAISGRWCMLRLWQSALRIRNKRVYFGSRPGFPAGADLEVMYLKKLLYNLKNYILKGIDIKKINDII